MPASPLGLPDGSSPDTPDRPGLGATGWTEELTPIGDQPPTAASSSIEPSPARSAEETRTLAAREVDVARAMPTLARDPDSARRGLPDGTLRARLRALTLSGPALHLALACALAVGLLVGLLLGLLLGSPAGP